MSSPAPAEAAAPEAEVTSTEPVDFLAAATQSAVEEHGDLDATQAVEQPTAESLGETQAVHPPSEAALQAQEAGFQVYDAAAEEPEPEPEPEAEAVAEEEEEEEEQVEQLDQGILQMDPPEQDFDQQDFEQQEDAGFNFETDALAVEFVLMPEGLLHAGQFDPNQDIGTLKQHLGQQFSVDPTGITLTVHSVAVADEDTLQELEANSEVEGALQFEMVFASDAKLDYKMPDVIEVHLNKDEEMDDETLPDIVYVKVVRENLNKTKPFLGGFRHTKTEAIYHHATSQTKRKKKKQRAQKFHRETQTVEVVGRSQQTTRESGTQMDRNDLYLDHSNDRVFVARPYFTADQLEAVRQQKAEAIQCFLRQCFAWRRVRRLREEKQQGVQAQLKAVADQKAADDLSHQKQIQRRMHPRTAKDFEVLHAELEAWRLHETARIKNANMSEEDKQEELKKLLAKEVKLLQTIDRLKITASKENKFQRTKETLEKMSSPKEWFSTEGDVVEVETPFTTRAKELVELYNGLMLKDISKEERIDVLLHVKYTVDEFDCELTRDMIHLIQREEDLLRRGRPDKSMVGLRKRLANLFLQFIETPEFNPESATFQRVPFVEVNTQDLPYIRRILNNKQVLSRPTGEHADQYEYN